jgi:hypothetical protein
LGHDQGVAEPLMVSLFVGVRHELVDGAEQSPLPKQDQVSGAGEFHLSFRLTHPDVWRAVRLAHWVRAAKHTQRGPTCSLWSLDSRPRKIEANRTDRPIGDFSVSGTPRRPEGSYAAWRV